MTKNPLRWFQLSLRTMFWLTFVAAAFFGGYSLAMRSAERELRRAEDEAQRQLNDARLQIDVANKRAELAERTYIW